jgi:stage V sporulation protein G
MVERTTKCPQGLRVNRRKSMEITEVKVFPVNEEKLKAYVTIVLDKCFVVRDLKIINGSTGLFVAMPSKKRADGSYKDIAHPLDKDTRVMMEKIVLEAYLAEIKKGSAPASNDGDSHDHLGNE